MPYTMFVNESSRPMAQNTTRDISFKCDKCKNRVDDLQFHPALHPSIRWLCKHCSVVIAKHQKFYRNPLQTGN